MQKLDFVMIALYAVVMLAIGHYYKRRVQTTDDYLLGGRAMNPFMVGLSLFATLMSTLSYLAYPGEMIKHGPMMFAQVAAFPIALVIIGWWLIPRIMAQHDVTSGYELLEKRLGLPGRLLGASMFMALRIVWMSAILYATTTKVVVPLLRLDPEWAPFLGIPFWVPCISATMGVITLVYSTEGGMRAVVATDALQSLIMCAGAVLVLGTVTADLGGVSEWWPTTWASHWQEPVFWFKSNVRVTFMGAMLNMAVWMTCTCGSDQMAIQRYLSTRDAKAARTSLTIHLITDVVMATLLALVGLAVLAYFTANPIPEWGDAALVDKADQLLPRFVVYVLPAGISGLVIAAILSAAMSSLSSGINSSSAVITNDFIGRLRRHAWTPEDKIRIARWVSIAIGVTAVLLSMFVGQLASNLLDLCIKVVNLLTAPLFVLFFLALFVRRSTPAGAIAATIAGVAVAVGIAFFQWWGLEMLWVGPVSLVVGIVVGTMVSFVTPAAAAGR